MLEKKFVWEVTGSPYVSEHLTSTRSFGVKNPVHLVDQYSGKRPALLNEEFFHKKRIDLKTYASALLDSNVVSLMDRFVQCGVVTDGWLGFIEFLTIQKWDFSCYFYYLEHFAKSNDCAFIPNALRRTKSILLLHSMDEAHYLATGEIRSNPEALSHYLHLNGGSESLDELAEKRLLGFMSMHNRYSLRENIKGIEVCLIKMILIRRFEMKKESPANQYHEFIRFMLEDLNVYFAREAQLALHYFAGRGDKLLGVQPNTSYLRSVNIVKSTAWDMYFLRVPESLLSGPGDEFCMCYIATQERKLYELAKCFTVERVEGNGAELKPVIGFEMDDKLTALYPEAASLIGVSRNGPVEIPAGLFEALHKQLAAYSAGS